MVQIFESTSNVRFSCKVLLEILGHKIPEQMSDICMSESTGRFVETSMAEKILQFLLQIVEEYQQEEDELFYEGGNSFSVAALFASFLFVLKRSLNPCRSSGLGRVRLLIPR